MKLYQVPEILKKKLEQLELSTYVWRLARMSASTFELFF